ncbi:MAG: metal ABC transporter permease [Corynebacteriales bacterium]|nr:metal ABC transporter permease [Mycobacteriales bacterium]
MEILQYDFMVRALIAALLVGLTAPAVGIYLVQRRMALMGDGIGHIALTGVAAGFFFNTSPVWTAVIVAALGGIIVELIRSSTRTSGDVALAMLFYGGIAGGVLLMGLADTSNVNLMSYLFGSLLTTSAEDLWVIGGLAMAVLAVTLGGRKMLFAICHDEEYAKVAGLPVRFLNLLLVVTAAVTVTVAMRVVGLLLVSALMVVPVAAASQLTRGFMATLALALTIGVLVSVGGAGGSFYLDTAPGATIVVTAIAVFLITGSLAAFAKAVRRWTPQ